MVKKKKGETRFSKRHYHSRILSMQKIDKYGAECAIIQKCCVFFPKSCRLKLQKIITSPSKHKVNPGQAFKMCKQHDNALVTPLLKGQLKCVD